jgi:isoaspartyl peptidase/L-asparaginase-like protein (Ntn-hydrolase superfamily)
VSARTDRVHAATPQGDDPRSLPGGVTPKPSARERGRVYVLVHGGAGDAPESPGPRAAALDAAARRGAGAETPLDAVSVAVRTLEADPRFNAGVGGAVQSDGVVRTDAGVMTDGRRVGAVAGLAGVAAPVTVARAVLAETPHVLLAGDPARAFAADVGVETGVDLLTPPTRDRFARADPPTGSPRDHLAWVRDRFGGDGDGGAGAGDDPFPPPGDHDTVGAVARSGDAFAAATSTAGRWFALAGRVGDVPQVGSGVYCSPAGAASATGAGEDIARVTLARRAVDRLADGAPAAAAAEAALAGFADETGAEAGLILLGREGAGVAARSEAMQTARARAESPAAGRPDPHQSRGEKTPRWSTRASRSPSTRPVSAQPRAVASVGETEVTAASVRSAHSRQDPSSAKTPARGQSVS